VIHGFHSVNRTATTVTRPRDSISVRISISDWRRAKADGGMPRARAGKACPQGHLRTLVTLSCKHYRAAHSWSEGPPFSNSFAWLRRRAAFTNSDTASRLTLSYFSQSEIERESDSSLWPLFSAASAASWMSCDCDVSGVELEDTYVLFRMTFPWIAKALAGWGALHWRFE
jgi:hypothetical protein